MRDGDLLVGGTGLAAGSGARWLPQSLAQPFRAGRDALDDLLLPNDLPRTIVAFVGENENGILRQMSLDFMGLAAPHGLTGHVVNLRDPGWMQQFNGLLDRGVLFGWGAAGIGGRLKNRDGLIWDMHGVPFISVMADTPCWMPANHHVPSRFVANGYLFADWLDVQRRFIRSPQLSSLLPHGVMANPDRDALPWSRRPHRMLFVKTGGSPERRRAGWAELPRRFRAVIEDAAAMALQGGVADIVPPVLQAFEHHGLYAEQRPDLLFGVMAAVDVYVRDTRSTAMVRALLGLSATIVGRGWDHVDTARCRARFIPAIDAAALPSLYADTQFLLNTMPNLSSGTHERVANGFAARCCVVSDDNADMRRRFRGLPSYHGVDTAAPDLADRLTALFHDEAPYDDRTQPALDLADAEFSGEAFMRGLIDLALELRAATAFAAYGL